MMNFLDSVYVVPGLGVYSIAKGWIEAVPDDYPVTPYERDEPFIWAEMTRRGLTPSGLAGTADQMKRAVSDEAERLTDQMFDFGVQDPQRLKLIIMTKAAKITDYRARGEAVPTDLADQETFIRGLEANALAVQLAEAYKHAQIDALADDAARRAYDVTAGWDALIGDALASE